MTKKHSQFVASLPVLYDTVDPTKTINPIAPGQEFINKTTGELFICVDNTQNNNRWFGYNGTSVNIPQGQRLFNTVGDNSFTVPAGVTYISAVLVGGGGGGSPSWSSSAGGGGALAYANKIPVTPGETITVTVGGGGLRASSGGDTIIARGATMLFKAEGGKYNAKSVRAAPVAGTITPKGGSGGLCNNNGYGGGGGAGGYSGNGGDGGYGPYAGELSGHGAGGGGAGGTGYQSSTYGFGGGGGVGLLGQGESGRFDFAGPNSAAGNSWSDTYYSYGGQGGSGGDRGAPNNNSSAYINNRIVYHGEGGQYGGGGGGGGTSVSNDQNFCKGGQGGARIIWGANRAYPSTNTADVTTIV